MLEMQADETGKSAQELAVELSTQGMTIKEISLALKIPYGTIYGWLRKGRSDKRESGINASTWQAVMKEINLGLIVITVI